MEEGDRNFTDVEGNIEAIVKGLNKVVIVKEVGLVFLKM